MKKKILFIHPFLPYPLTSGGHQALFNGIMSVKDDYDVYVTYRCQEVDTYQEAYEGIKKHLESVTFLPFVSPIQGKIPFRLRVIWKVRRLMDKILGTNDAQPKVARNPKVEWWKDTVTPNNEKWIAHLHDIFNRYNFDVVQVEMPWMISDVFSIPNSVKKIYVHHELGFVRRELELKTMVDDTYAQTCKRFADFNEIGQLNLYDAVVTLSPIDKQKLKYAGVVAPIHTSFAIVDTSKELVLPSTTNKRLTFIGPDSHNPNYVGITWFLENCWAKLNTTDSEFTLDIIGKWSNKNKEEFINKYPGVNFLGFVDDLYDALKGSVMIVPITVGSGIRMKILEACSMGIPFVSTTVGAEGIPVEDGKHCFLTGDANVFVESIIKLQDINLQKQFVKNSFNMVKKTYSLEALRKNRIEIYEKC